MRVRQVLSVIETRYDDETIVLIAPDSTVLTVLQAALLGIDLRDHWTLAYQCDLYSRTMLVLIGSSHK